MKLFQYPCKLPVKVEHNNFLKILTGYQLYRLYTPLPIYYLKFYEHQKLKQIFQMKSRIAKTAEELENIQKKLREQQLTIQMEQEDFQAELEGLLPQVPEDWLKRYRKIANSHRGIGMAKLKNNTCGACHIRQSDALLQQIKRGDDKMVFCENCGRILCY